jgi:arylsulfatase A-like enzyme
MISNVDIVPSLLDFVGIEGPRNIHGRSFARLLEGGEYTPRTEIFAEKTFHSYYDPMRAIRTERFKYIRNFESNFAVEIPSDIHMGPKTPELIRECVGSKHPPAELYDLSADPVEKTNLAGEAKDAEVERDLRQRLLQWMKETKDPLLEGAIPSVYYESALHSLEEE